MKNLHIYMLPIAAGAFACMLSPLADTAVMAYSLVAIIVITGMIGLQVLAKNKAITNDKREQMLLFLEQLQTKVGSLEQSVTKQEHIAQQQRTEQLMLTKENKQQYTQLLQAIVEHVTSMEEQVKQQANTVSTRLEQFQQLMQHHLPSIEDKVDDGNKVLENVSILLVKELQTVNDRIEEIINVQHALPSELNNLQDVIASNQEQLIDNARDLEMHVVALKDMTTTHYEQSEQSQVQMIERILAPLATLQNAVQQEMAAWNERVNHMTQNTEHQLMKATNIIENIEQLNQSLQQANKVNHQNVAGQLNSLQEIQTTLLQGVTQLTNSQNVERKQLLAIQKNLINKYSK